MSEGQRDVRLFLTDVLEAIQKIDSCTDKMIYKEFVGDEKTKDAVLRNLEVMERLSRIFQMISKEAILRQRLKALFVVFEGLVFYFAIVQERDIEFLLGDVNTKNSF